MAFWIFMLFSNLLIPFVMILFGMIFVKKPPKHINGWYGYRTSMSSKNMETWNFAHLYFGKIWRMEGWILLLVVIIAMFFVLGKDIDTIGFYSLVINIIELILMLIPIVLTETALHERFDKDGIQRY